MLGAALRIVEIAAGAAIVVLALADVFLSVILPRAVDYRFRASARVSRPAWRFWRGLAQRMDDEDRREGFLGAYAPFVMVLFLAMWVALLVVGYGLIFYGLREQLRPLPTFGEALYFAGTSLLTIGYGDFVPVTGATRFLALLAGASGFGVVAVSTAFLFQVFAAFQAREVFVVTFGTRAGAPPSGVTLLENYARLGIFDQLEVVFAEGQRWAAELMGGHLAYPILAYFRSSHDYESWTGTIGALLDGSTLVLTLVAGGPQGQARLMNDLGRHLVHDLSNYFGLGSGHDVGVERYEFELARTRLAEAGVAVRDADDAWEDFARIRSSYAMSLNAMARWWRIPPVQWVSDRSLLPVGHVASAKESAFHPETVSGKT